jgi:hypothetical protein
MARRSGFDPLKTSDERRWLARLDAHGDVIESEELPPRTNLRVALTERLLALREAGWTVEGVSYSGTFVRKGDKRHRVAIYPRDPTERFVDSHGTYPASASE